MNFEYVYLEKMEMVRRCIQNCEGVHTQQVVYSTFHDALTQICYGCKEIRTNIKIFGKDLEEEQGQTSEKALPFRPPCDVVVQTTEASGLSSSNHSLINYIEKRITITDFQQWEAVKCAIIDFGIASEEDKISTGQTMDKDEGADATAKAIDNSSSSPQKCAIEGCVDNVFDDCCYGMCVVHCANKIHHYDKKYPNIRLKKGDA